MARTKFVAAAAVVALLAISGGAVASTFEVNTDSCGQVRWDDPATLVLAIPPFPDGRTEGLNTVQCVPGVGVISLFATDDGPRPAKTSTVTLDKQDIDNVVLDVRLQACVNQQAEQCNYQDIYHNPNQGNCFVDCIKIASVPHPGWLCDVVTLIRCIDTDIVGMQVIATDGTKQASHSTTYSVKFISRVGPITTPGMILDPGNDNRLVQATETYWKIHDPDGDGQLVLSFPVEGLSVSYQNGHWIVESLNGDPIMVDHEPSLERWAIRLL